MTTRHTPGPWWVDPDYLGDIQAEGTEIASAYEDSDEGREWCIRGPITVSREEQRANARLIAASPEMLEVLQDIDEDGLTQANVLRMKAVIAKATDAAE